jgi:peptide/nickel transport system ATP-binding protein
LSAVPIPDPEADQAHIRLSGNVPSALDPPTGCRFHTRCPRRKELLPNDGEICKKEIPPWQQSEKGHRIKCHIPLDVLEKLPPVVHAA